jgi:hypothetical protein
MERHSRPGYVSLLCWWTMIKGGFALSLTLSSACAAYLTRDYGGLKVALIGMIACVLAIAVAVAMHGGANWARLLFYFPIAPLTVAGAIAAVPHQTNPGVAIPGVVAVLVITVIWCIALGQPRANRFFTGSSKTFFRRKQREGSRSGGGSSGDGRRRQSRSSSEDGPSRRDFNY